MHAGRVVIVYEVNLVSMAIRLSIYDLLLLWLFHILITRMHSQGTPLFNILWSVYNIAFFN